MPTFNYIGRDPAGQQVKGSLEGPDINMVAKQLNRQLITPTSIEVKKERKEQNQNQSKTW